MKVSELIEYLRHIDPDYKVVIGLGGDHHEIDDVETNHSSELCAIWFKSDDK